MMLQKIISMASKISSSNMTSTTCSNTSQISIEFPGRVTGANTDNFLLTGLMSHQSTTALAITDVLQILPVVGGVHRCSHAETSAMCNEDCAIEAVWQQCGCIPEGAKFSNSYDQLASR